MNGLICLLVFCLLAVTALAALGLCRRLFSHELPEHMATLALLESQAQWERRTGCPADLDRPGHGAHSLAGGCHAGRQPGTGLHGILQTAQRLLLLPAVGVDENFWQRCGIRKK